MAGYVYACNPTCTGGKIGESSSDVALGKIMRPYLKIKAKSTEGLAQVVEYLPSKYKA